MQSKQRLMLQLLLRQNNSRRWRQTRPPPPREKPATPTEDQGLYPRLAHATPFERGTFPQSAIFDAFLVPDDAPGPRALFTYTFMLLELLYHFCLLRFHFSFPLSVHFLSSFCIRSLPPSLSVDHFIRISTYNHLHISNPPFTNQTD